MALSSRLQRARLAYRGLVARGLAPAEAANVAAWLVGLDPAEGGWTQRSTEQLLFLAWEVRSGRLRGDTTPDPETVPWAVVWT